MNFKMNEQEMVFENEEVYIRMAINNIGEGKLGGGQPRLKCYTTTSILLKETNQIITVPLTFYWDAKYICGHFIFTGGKLKPLVEESNLEWDEFSKYWNQVKRLALMVFSEEQIVEYQKKMKKGVVA